MVERDLTIGELIHMYKPLAHINHSIFLYIRYLALYHYWYNNSVIITASYTYPSDIMTIPTSSMWLLSMTLVCVCQWQAVPVKIGEIYDNGVRQAVDSKELIRRFNV